MLVGGLAVGMGLGVVGPDPAVAKVTAKLASTAPTTHPNYPALQFFAKRVAEKTSGEVEINVFPGNQLGGEREAAEGLQLGTIELGEMSTAILGNFEPTIQILDLPFIFRDRQHSFQVLDGPIGDEIRANVLKRGIRIFSFLEFGFRYVHDGKRPIVTPEDMKGLKFRVMQNPVHIAMYEALGARAIPMARPEVYAALKQGVLDGLDNALVWYEKMGDYEVAKYLTLEVPVLNTVGTIAASEKWYQTLSPAQQKAVQDAALEARDLQRKLFHEEENKVLERLKQKGVIVTRGDNEAFRKQMIKVWDQFATKVGGMQKIQAIVDTK
jgi:tripartite ATP-independent transporter DctP family solute receptor